MNRPRLLDLFCGGGGAAMGYHQAGFEVVGVDHLPQPHYPFDFIQADALEFLVAHWAEYDVIHASPPCQRFSKCTPPECKAAHPDLLTPTLEFLRSHDKPYIVENVPGAQALMQSPIMLCGTMFGLPIWRHRFFEMRPMGMYLLSPCNHSGSPVLVSGTTRPKGQPRREASVTVRRKAIGIDWMTDKELDQAIPPAYTQWLGERTLEWI